jgi:hypothetical protein
LTLLDRVRAADPDAGRRPVHLYRALRRLRQEMVGLVEA